MMFVEPAEIFHGVMVITAPHMDDGVLACGGTIARLSRKERIHIIYATDGMRSPAPVLPWRDSISADLGELRMKEAKAAMGRLGVQEENIHFLKLPEDRLRSHMKTLSRLLTELIGQIKPNHVLIPFRYDRHADHLALNHAMTTSHHNGMYEAELTEYFVYYRWRLLPKGDVRMYIHPRHLLTVNIEDVSAMKRSALECFKTQTTRFYEWQTRPNLTQQLLDEVSRKPEFFLQYDRSFPGATVFNETVNWIRLVHRLEPYLKKRKDWAIALWPRTFDRNETEKA